MEVRLFATLREGRGKVIDVPWSAGMDGFSLFAALGIDETDIAVFLINGAHSKHDAALKETDVVALFPPTGGG